MVVVGRKVGQRLGRAKDLAFLAGFHRKVGPEDLLFWIDRPELLRMTMLERESQ